MEGEGARSEGVRVVGGCGRVGDDLLTQKCLRVRGHIGEVVRHHKYLDDCSVWIEQGLSQRERDGEEIGVEKPLHTQIAGYMRETTPHSDSR